MTFGSLFAGIGGIDLGLERAGLKCRFQVEIDPFCRKVLDKHWPEVPKFADVTKVTGAELGYVDVLAGGFPCQDLSQAGKRAGLSGDRSGLWFEFARLIGEIRPRFVVAENVSGLLTMPGAMGTVIGELARLGYVGSNVCLRASDFGAAHLRKRVFIVAHDDCGGLGRPNEIERSIPQGGRDARDVAGSESSRTQLAHGTPRGWRELREPSRRDGLTDGSNKELDNPDSDGTQRPRGAEQGVESGCEELANPSRDARHGSHGQDGQGRGVCETGDRMGEPIRARRETPGIGCDVDAGREPEAGCGSVADASDGQLSEPRWGSQGRNGTGSAGAILPYSSTAGLPDSEQTQLSGPQWDDEGRATSELCGAFAPGPSDPRWPDILRIRPDLAPALESPERSKRTEEAAQPGICELADGFSDGLVRSAMKDRTKKLKALGNSVVPQCAEYIGTILMRFND